VVVTSGGQHVDGCLEALERQRLGVDFEVIVPVDDGVAAADVARWRARFPDVRLPLSGPAASSTATRAAASARLDAGRRDAGMRHLDYDLRRGRGIAAARAPLVALTEDHARPAPDWCQAIARAHAEWPHAAIGGAIDDDGRGALASAVYFADFGRYQRPLSTGPSPVASDVNVSYKRTALAAVAASWHDGYHETAVHAALLARGETIWLDERILVHQQRGPLQPMAALRERFAWGRLYAGRRAHTLAPAERWGRLVATPLLPALLWWRAARTAVARGRQRRRFVRACLPLVPLLCAWSLGEAVGLATRRPVAGRSARAAAGDQTAER